MILKWIDPRTRRSYFLCNFSLSLFLSLSLFFSSRASRLRRNHYPVPKYVLRRRMCNNEADGTLMDTRAHRREASEHGQTRKERKGSFYVCQVSARFQDASVRGSPLVELSGNLTCFLFDTFSGPYVVSSLCDATCRLSRWTIRGNFMPTHY